MATPESSDQSLSNDKQARVRRSDPLGEGYSPDNFYFGALDEKGHGAWTKQVRLHPRVSRQIEELIQGKAIPGCKTVGDFIRDAAVHRLAQIRDRKEVPGRMREKIDEMVAWVHLDDTMAAYRQELHDMHKLRDDFIDTAQTAVADQDWETFSILLFKMRTDAELVREPFRGQLLRLIDDYEKKIEGLV